MNPMYDTALSVTHLAQGQIDARRNPLAAQALRNRIELQRAMRRHQSAEKRRTFMRKIVAGLRQMVRYLPTGLRSATPSTPSNCHA